MSRNARLLGRGHGRCGSCNVPLLQANGYAGTGLCGPCCTGEADTSQDLTVECPKHGHAAEVDGACVACRAKR